MQVRVGACTDLRSSFLVYDTVILMFKVYMGYLSLISLCVVSRYVQCYLTELHKISSYMSLLRFYPKSKPFHGQKIIKRQL